MPIILNSNGQQILYTRQKNSCTKAFWQSCPYLLSNVIGLATGFWMDPQAAEGFPKNRIIRFFQTLKEEIKKNI